MRSSLLCEMSTSDNCFETNCGQAMHMIWLDSFLTVLFHYEYHKRSTFKKYQCGFLALAFVMLLIIGSGGDDEIKPDTSKNLRQPEPPAAQVIPKPDITNVVNTPEYATVDADKEYEDEIAEEELEIETEVAMDEIDEAEEEEIESES